MRQIIIKGFLSLIIIVGVVSHGFSQDQPSLQNLSSINIDQLTDAQILKFVKQAESSGYSQQQLEVLAQARGMSAAQVSKLRARIQQIQGSASGQSNIPNSDVSRLRDQPGFISDKATEFDPFTDITPEDPFQKKDGLPIFGSSFFANQNLTMDAPVNIPTPENYVLGPGDQLIIDVWGASEQSYQLTLSPEGNILVPSVGPIYLNGLTVEKADARIRARLKSIYSTLGSNTFAQISLGQLKTIQVNVIGEVVKPGTYPLSSFASPIHALYASGGPSESGSFRDIQIYRGGAKVATYDLYSFLVTGDAKPITLQDQDVVLVKPYGDRIRLTGEVKRPSYYELKSGETFSDLLNYSGGFNEYAYTESISLQRNGTNAKTIETLSKDAFEKEVLQNGDRIEVGAITNRFLNRVRIEGAVNHAGEFQLTEGMTLGDLIKLADGIRGDAFMGQALIIRLNEDFTLSNLAFNPSELEGEAGNLVLQNEDLVKVQSLFDLKEKFVITIQGEVNKPGAIPYVEGMTVENLIYMAGGFKETAARSSVEVARRILDNSKDQSISSEIFNFPISETLDIQTNASTFLLNPFDLVVIRKSPFYEKQVLVEIEGEATYPGKYVLEKKNERISDLLIRAGNLTSLAYAQGATLIRRTEYFVSEEEGTDQAAKVRRAELQAIFERDTIVQAGTATFKTQESIGIKLDEILKNPGSDLDLILKEGDILSIPRQLQTIRVRGEVLYPSTVPYRLGALSSFVSGAGGFSQRAKKNKAYVIYPNGSAKKTTAFLWMRKYPKVLPGSEIIIPQKPERRQLSPAEVISITTGMGTLALIINNLVK